MKKDDVERLESDGWEIDCESPFELSSPDGSRATGRAADYVVSLLRDICGYSYKVRMEKGGESKDVTVWADGFDDAAAIAQERLSDFRVVGVDVNKS